MRIVTVTEALDMGDDVLLVRGTVEGRWSREPVVYGRMTVSQLRSLAKSVGVDLAGARTKSEILSLFSAGGLEDDPGEPEVFEARGWVSAMTSHPAGDPDDDYETMVDEDGTESRTCDPKRREMTREEKLEYCKSLIATAVSDAPLGPAAPVLLDISG